MNCFFHENKPAVTACAKCGVGLCRDCMNEAAYTADGKPVCLNCSKPIAEEELQAAQKERVWSLVKCIFSGVFIGIGLLALAGGAGLEQVWIISGIAGIPTAFKATRRSREQRIMDDIHDRYEKDLINLMFGWAVRLLIKLAFIIFLAPICAFFTCISNLVTFLKAKKKIQEAEDTLKYIEECLYGNPEQQGSQAENTSYLPNTTEDTITNQSEIPSRQPEANTHTYHPTLTETASSDNRPTSFAPPKTSQTETSGNKKLTIGIIAGAVTLAALLAGYFVWYIPYAKDRDALRTYVVANNVFLRSSKVAGVEYNVLSRIPYGSELITYSKDNEWAEIKTNGVTGFVASSYLLEWNDFNLLNNVWGSTDTKEYIESSKCRFALLDYCKRNQLDTGSEGWQLYTLQKDVKPNNVLYPRFRNGYDKFTEFAFILKNNKTQERRLAIYSFNEESEAPIFLYDEQAPREGEIQDIKYRNQAFYVRYTGMPLVPQTSRPTANTPTANTSTPSVPPPPVPYIEAITESSSEQKPEETVDTNIIYQVVEQMPEYPGGVNELMRFISQNLKYPSYCQENGIQGKVLVTFVIDRDGTPINFRIKQSPDPLLGGEAMRVLKLMPKWKPGQQKGVAVKVNYTIPVNFKLG